MSRLQRAVEPHDWARGPASAPATLLEYADFECPFCGRAFHELKRLERGLRDRIRFVFRHFPLAQMHPHAMLAAEAAEAAGAQGKFWEMHDTLFTHQNALETPALLAYARELELDVRIFSRDLNERRYQTKVRRDFLEGVRSGVNGTPTMFINGTRWDGPYTAEALLRGMRGDPSMIVEPMTGFPWSGDA